MTIVNPVNGTTTATTIVDPEEIKKRTEDESVVDLFLNLVNEDETGDTVTLSGDDTVVTPVTETNMPATSNETEEKLTKIPSNIKVPNFTNGCAVINDDNTVTVYEDLAARNHDRAKGLNFEIRIYDRNGNLLSTTKANYLSNNMPYQGYLNETFDLTRMAETTETTFTEFASEEFINNFRENSSIPQVQQSAKISVTKEDGSIEETVYRGHTSTNNNNLSEKQSNGEISSASAMDISKSRYTKIDRYADGEYTNGDYPVSSKTITYPDGKIEVYEYYENGNLASKAVYDSTIPSDCSSIGTQVKGKLIESTSYWSNGNVKFDEDGAHDRSNPDIVIRDGKVYYKGELIYGVKDKNGNFRTCQFMSYWNGHLDDTTYYNEQIIGQLYAERLANYDSSSGIGLISSKSLCYCVEADECYIGTTKVSQDTALAVMDKVQYNADIAGACIFVHTINGKKVYTVRTNDGQDDPNFFSFTEEEFKFFEQYYENWQNQPQDKWLLDDNGNRMSAPGIFTGAFASNADGGDYFIALSGDDANPINQTSSCNMTLIDSCFDYVLRTIHCANRTGDPSSDDFYVNSLGIVSSRGYFLDCPHLDGSERYAFYWVSKLINGDTSGFTEAKEGKQFSDIYWYSEVEGSAPKRGEYYKFSNNSQTQTSETTPQTTTTANSTTSSPLLKILTETLNTDEDENDYGTDESEETPNATPQESEEYKTAKQQYDTLVKKLRETEAEKEKAQEEFQTELASQVAQAIANAQIEYISQTVEEGEEEIPYETFFDEEMAKITSKQFNSSVYDAKIQALNTQIEVAKNLMESLI